MRVLYRLQDSEFEWDEKKAKSNIRKHGVSFEEATEAFLDPFYKNGEASVDDEERDYIIGYSLSLRLLLVVYTERGRRNRIISARLATNAEKKSYEEA
ncbi:MAG: BrnT family toxin [candidate division KSB1 bacterium]